MRMASANYPRYGLVAALTLFVLVLSSAVTIKDNTATTLAPLAGQAKSASAPLRSGALLTDWSLSSTQIGTTPKFVAVGLSSLLLKGQYSISRSLGRVLPGYQFQAQGNGFMAANARHHLDAQFTPAGVKMRSGTARWKLQLRSYGYGNALQPVSAVIPHAKCNRVEYRRGMLTEWYVNGPMGLEQGFTLTQYPASLAGTLTGSSAHGVAHRQSTIENSLRQPLSIVLRLSGNLSPIVNQLRSGMTLTNRDRREVLRYSGLAAYDSSGKQLQTWLEVRGDQLLLKVDDATAR
jgi:hypothetical protein